MSGVGRSEDELERLKTHLRALSVSLPGLIERVQARADAVGHTLRPTLPDPELERRRLAGIADYLDRYARADGGTIGWTDVREVLAEAVELARGELERKAQLTVRYVAAPPVYANRQQLGHVFTSLLINAAQAIDVGTPAENAIGVELDTTSQGWARVAIADTGRGIDPGVLPLVFEPMFSTKRGAGLGLGLSLVREIIQNLGGGITVDSTLGAGAMFVIELPPVP